MPPPTDMPRFVSSLSFQAGSARLVNIGPHPEIIIAMNPASPAVYWLFDPQTATLSPREHRFDDNLKIDFTSLNPSLDPDGISYNCCVASAPLSFFFFFL